MQIPIVGDVPVNTLALVGLAIFCGYILGSQIKTAIKLILILVAGVAIFGLINIQNIGSLISLYTTLQPVLNDVTAKFGDSIEPSLLGFGIGFSLGVWKG
jgi:uncharacterized membrane protein (Fun14 family)